MTAPLNAMGLDPFFVPAWTGMNPASAASQSVVSGLMAWSAWWVHGPLTSLYLRN